MAEQLSHMLQRQHSFSVQEADLVGTCPAFDHAAYAAMVNRLFRAVYWLGQSRAAAHNCKNLVDRYLARVSVQPLDEIWLVVIAALWISVKMNNTAYRRPLAKISAGFGFARHHLLVQHQAMCCLLESDMESLCTPFHFADLFCQRLTEIRPLLPHQRDDLMYHVMYVVDYCLLDRSALAHSSSIMACAAMTLVALHPDANARGIGFTAQDLDVVFGGADAHQLALCVAFIEGKDVPPAPVDGGHYIFQTYAGQAMHAYVRAEELRASAQRAALIVVVAAAAV